MQGHIDLIITKSISRFARNTMDCLELVRLLTSHNVEIFFEKENLSTQNAGGELILSILASIAAEESRSISENGKWSIQKRFQKGTFKLSRAPYGYDLTDGMILVNPREAEIVRYIFNSILIGKGTSSIANELNQRNIPTKRQGRWHAGTIQSMIHNEFFTGNMLMQKTWRDSSFHVRFNYGELDQYYIENHHPAIVSREVFDAANLACAQRGLEKNNIPNEDKSLRNDAHHRRYCFTGKLICGNCGDTLKRQMIYRKDGSHAIWVCRTHLKDKESCHLKRILEYDIQNAFVTMLNKLAFSIKVLLQPYIESLLSYSGGQSPVQSNNDAFNNRRKAISDDEKKRLIMYYSKGKIEPVLYYKRLAELKHGIEPGGTQKASPSAPDESYVNAASEALNLSRFLGGWKIGANKFNEEVFIRFVDSVRIDSSMHITFCLKCGLELSETI